MLTVQLDAVDRDIAAESGLRDVVRRIRSARRIVVVCGISTAAGIPDFRSAKGLFSSESNGKGKGRASTQDLFHVRSLTSSTLLPAHHALLNELSALSSSAEPSAFHHLLARLDGEGRLLRCYTQNIDGLERKAGLEIGIPPKPAPSPRKKGIEPVTTNPRQQQRWPRCIPLHGQLDRLYCPLCATTVPLAEYLPLPSYSIICPTCDLARSIRNALSERSRKIGTLRASVVLYGEEHAQGEMIGSIVERDLRGTGPKDEKEGKADLLLVAGTSLSIPGVKRIVKELARSLHSSSRSTGNSSNRPSIILVNSELPKGKEWHSVFDTFIAGDIQDFVKRYHELPVLDASQPQTPKKRNSTTTPTKSKSKRSYLPTPETTVARKRVKLSTGSTDPRTPTKKSQHGQVTQPLTPSSIPTIRERAPGPLRIDVPPTPDATPEAKFQPSTAKTWMEAPLTPLSDAVSDKSDKNPFLV